MYDSEFSNRTRVFCLCRKNFFDKMSKYLNLEKICGKLSEKDLLDNNLIVNTILNQPNITENKNSKISEILNNFSSHDWSWYIETLFDC